LDVIRDYTLARIRLLPNEFKTHDVNMDLMINVLDLILVVINPTPTPTPTPAPTETPNNWERKWSQQPNMNDGFDVPSFTVESTGFRLIVADDWKCENPDPVVHITWWGSYKGWRPFTRDAVPPPPDRPSAFRLSWHEYTPGPPYSMPGPLIREEICTEFSEEWYGAVPVWNIVTALLWEHEYIYQQTLKVPWDQQLGETYFLNIAAVYTVDTSYPAGTSLPEHWWGWKNSADHWNDDAVQLSPNGVWIELRWPDGHSLGGESMDMAFELWTSP
jgi:hypothetical protein